MATRKSPDETSGSERDRYISAIEHYRQHQLSQALALLEREGSPLDNVRSLVRFFEEHAAGPPPADCLVTNAFVQMCPRDPQIATLLRETLELLRAGVERSLHDARLRGELAKEESPQSLSRALTNAVMGLAVTGYADTLSMLD